MQTFPSDPMSNKFANFDLVELRTLHRVFREAKFCLVAYDDEVSNSPRVAQLFEALQLTLMEKDCEESDSRRDSWLKWLEISEERDEWRAALGRIKTHSPWQSYTPNEKREYVRTLLAPFQLTTENESLFLTQANQLS